jgi:hypothetical protein
MFYETSFVAFVYVDASKHDRDQLNRIWIVFSGLCGKYLY